MSDAVCPHCGARLFPFERAESHCPSCRRPLATDITAAPTSPPAAPLRGGGLTDLPPPEEEEGPYPPGRSVFLRSGAGWGPFRAGLEMLFWGLVLCLLGGV